MLKVTELSDEERKSSKLQEIKEKYNQFRPKGNISRRNHPIAIAGYFTPLFALEGYFFYLVHKSDTEDLTANPEVRSFVHKLKPILADEKCWVNSGINVVANICYDGNLEDPNKFCPQILVEDLNRTCIALCENASASLNATMLKCEDTESDGMLWYLFLLLCAAGLALIVLVGFMIQRGFEKNRKEYVGEINNLLNKDFMPGCFISKINAVVDEEIKQLKTDCVEIVPELESGNQSKSMAENLSASMERGGILSCSKSNGDIELTEMSSLLTPENNNRSNYS